MERVPEVDLPERPALVLRPVGDWLTYKLGEAGRSPGGIILSTVEGKRPCIVVAVGPDVTRVRPGDHVLHAPGTARVGSDATGEQLFFCRDEEIAAVVEPAPPCLEVVG